MPCRPWRARRGSSRTAAPRGQARHVSASGPPENATIAAPAPGWPSVASQVRLTGPSDSRSGASSARRQNAILQRDEALDVRAHLRRERRRQRRVERDLVPHRRRRGDDHIVGLERLAVGERTRTPRSVDGNRLHRRREQHARRADGVRQRPRELLIAAAAAVHLGVGPVTSRAPWPFTIARLRGSSATRC